MPHVLSTASKQKLQSEQQQPQTRETITPHGSATHRKRPRYTAATWHSTSTSAGPQLETTIIGSARSRTSQKEIRQSGSLSHKKEEDHGRSVNNSCNRHLFQIRVGSVVALRMGKAASTPIPISTTTSTIAKAQQKQQQPLQSQQSTIDLSSYTSVWTNPDPHRDAGLALVGHRIRCSFPKPTNPSKNQRTVLEGEIIHVEAFHHHNNNNSSRDTMDSSQSVNNQNNTEPNDNDDDDDGCWAVELLVEERVLPYFPTLRRLDTYWDDDHAAPAAPAPANGSSNNPPNPLSAKAKKRRAMERQIQGPDTAVVKVLLWRRPDWVSSHSSHSTAHKWVIEKRVPVQLFHLPRSVGKSTTAFSTNSNDPSNKNGAPKHSTTNSNISGGDHDGEKNNDKTGNGNGKVQLQQQQQQDGKPPSDSKKKPRRTSVGASTSATAAANQQITIRHVGDGHDSPEQQIANWRWLACRYHDLRRSFDDADATEFLAAGFVGHVLAMQPSRSSGTTTEASSTTATLAQVTVRRLFWPEHLRCGRLPHLRRHSNWLFQEGDVDVQIQVPVEHLVMVGRKLRMGSGSNSSSSINHDSGGETNDLCMQWAYSWRHDCFQAVVDPLAAIAGTGESAARTDETIKNTAINASMRTICHRCRRPRNQLLQCTSPDNCPLQQQQNDSVEPAHFCKSCLKVLKERRAREISMLIDAELLPCCTQCCDCPSCDTLRCTKLQAQLLSSLMKASQKLRQQPDCVVTAKENPVNSVFPFDVVAAVREMQPIDFSLPSNFFDPCNLPIPQAKPSKRVKKAKTGPAKAGRRSGKEQQQARSPKGGRKPGRPRTPTKKAAPEGKNDVVNPMPFDRPKEDYSVFKPTCARTQIYDPTQYNLGSVAWSDPVISDYREPVRNLRDLQERNSRLLTVKKDDSVRALSSSRAARATQRRLMKDVAWLGMTTASLGVDALASREPQLRFDRSSIHAWGVFADEDINAGEMIVEYRGELIGNAVAERREVEYEAAKIGSDYMFRIDALNVCDATKQGNVARFINASCDPNCYTKIITMDGTKRIVIYAKKDISMGDELCYDYKFPVEYEESRRIPCHCGARDCRGFMNWDKRYVVAPVLAQEATEASKRDQQAQNHSHRPLKCAAEENTTEEATDFATSSNPRGNDL